MTHVWRKDEWVEFLKLFLCSEVNIIPLITNTLIYYLILKYFCFLKYYEYLYVNFIGAFNNYIYAPIDIYKNAIHSKKVRSYKMFRVFYK